VLAGLGIDVPRGELAATATEAAEIGARLGGTVVVKAHGRGFAHKTDVGAVAIGVEAGDIPGVCVAMAKRLAAAAPEAMLEGFLVEEEVAGGVECVIGAVWEEPFGHLVMVGMGGTGVELLGDVAFGIAPIGLAEAEAMIRSLRSYPLLEGHRGTPRLDIEAFAHAVSAVSLLCAAEGSRLRELDVNPIRVREHGAVALDVLAVVDDDHQPRASSQST
jgi:acyl-CoA synthetase (NDP forming)